MNLKISILRLTLLSMAIKACTAMAQQIDYTQPYLQFDQPEVWQPYVGATYAYDSNLFRTPTLLQQNGQPTSDTSWTRTGGLGFDKTYSRQHISANVDVTKATFDRFSFIDYDGKDATLNWGWGITNDFSGNIGTIYSESLTPFTQFHTVERNLRKQKTNSFDGVWRMTPNWRVHASTTDYQLKYELVTEQYGNRDVHTAVTGLDYVSDAGNTLGFFLQREHGEFPNQQLIGQQFYNNNYVQDSLKLNLDWTLSGHTHIQATLGKARRSYDQYPVRDVTGPTAHVTVSYQATGKSALSMSAWRDINATDNLSVNYAVDKGISAAATWDALPKIRIQASLKHESYDYSGSSAFTAQLPQNRIDTMTNASLSAVYTPFRKVQFSIVFYSDRLKSSIELYDYRDRGFVLNARAAF
ncbi:exopolysaccharide biosynthesis operon protein EpsL [Oxalobacteraceae bacterium GrIS 2.11]